MTSAIVVTQGHANAGRKKTCTRASPKAKAGLNERQRMNSHRSAPIRALNQRPTKSKLGISMSGMIDTRHDLPSLVKEEGEGHPESISRSGQGMIWSDVPSFWAGSRPLATTCPSLPASS